MEFSTFQISKFLQLDQATRAGRRVFFVTLLREPYARLMSQFKHDKCAHRCFLRPYKARPAASESSRCHAAPRRIRLPSRRLAPFIRPTSVTSVLCRCATGRHYTPYRFRNCPSLANLVKRGSNCIEKGEAAYRYQNFQTMMLGGCSWDNKRRVCVASEPFKPAALLSRFTFFGINEHFQASVCLFYYTLSDHWRFEKYCKGAQPEAPLPFVMSSAWMAKKEEAAAVSSVRYDTDLLRFAMDTNVLDFRLYWTAHEIFMSRVKVMEKEVGEIVTSPNQKFEGQVEKTAAARHVRRKP